MIMSIPLLPTVKTFLANKKGPLQDLFLQLDLDDYLICLVTPILKP